MILCWSVSQRRKRGGSACDSCSATSAGAWLAQCILELLRSAFRGHSRAASAGISTADSGQTKGSGDGATSAANRVPTARHHRRSDLGTASKRERAALLAVQRSSSHPPGLGANCLHQESRDLCSGRGPSCSGCRRFNKMSARLEKRRECYNSSIGAHRPKRLAGQGEEVKTSARKNGCSRRFPPTAPPGARTSVEPKYSRSCRRKTHLAVQCHCSPACATSQ